MMYSLEFEGEGLAVYCYGQRLGFVPPEMAAEVWSIGTNLARQQQWGTFAGFCAGLVYGSGKIGVPDLAEAVGERVRLTGAAVDLPKVPPAEGAPPEHGNVIGFPGGRHDHD